MSNEIERAPSQSDALRSGVLLVAMGLLLHSSWSFLKLIELAEVDGWLGLSLGVGWTLASAFGAGWLKGSRVRGVWWIRVSALVGLAGLAPLCLYGLGHQSGAPATGLFYGVTILASLAMGPELAVIVAWGKQALSVPEGASAETKATEGPEEPVDVDEEGVFRSWLLTSLHVIVPLSMIAIVVPYMGRIAAHVLVCASLAWWLFPRDEAMGLRQRLLPMGWFLSFVGVFVAFFAWPMPQALTGNEIIYTDIVGGQPVTVHARKAERRVYYTVTTKRAVVYGTITGYRQGEMLAHPAMAFAPPVTREPNGKARPRRVLILGSEDGSVLRELARYQRPQQIVWVPLFSFWRGFFSHAPLLSRDRIAPTPQMQIRKTPVLPNLSVESLQLLIDDFGKGRFDVVIADLPKIWKKEHALSKESLSLLLSLIHEKGVISAQLASPYTQADLYWCLVGQWAGLGAHVVPYQLTPSLYQDFGYALISKRRLKAFARPMKLPAGTHYLRRSQPMSVLARFAKESTPNGRTNLRRCLP